MAKSTTTAKRKAPLTLAERVERLGGAQAVASAARVGYATVYRALKGNVPERVQVYALSLTLGISEDELKAEIQAAAKGAA